MAVPKMDDQRIREKPAMHAQGLRVTHEINDCLTVIIGYAELLLVSQCGQDRPARMQLEEIRKAGKRAAGLTRELLDATSESQSNANATTRSSESPQRTVPKKEQSS